MESSCSPNPGKATSTQQVSVSLPWPRSAGANYILLTQKIGDRFTGVGGLTITVPIAALTAAIAGIPQAAGDLSFSVIAVAVALTNLHPVLPFTFQLLALRHMTPTAFGTLMAIEPAIGVLLGIVVLHQIPTAVQITGIVLVVVAGTAAQREGRQRPHPELEFVG